MKKLRELFANLAWRQVLTVVLAGVLMLTTVACSGSKASTPQAGNPSIGGGDMYPHADTTRDTSAADAKARREIRQAEKRREKVLNPNKDYLEETKPAQQAKKQTQRAVESAQETADDVGNAAQRAAGNAARNTQQGLKNLKDNTQDAVEQAADAVDLAT